MPAATQSPQSAGPHRYRATRGTHRFFGLVIAQVLATDVQPVVNASVAGIEEHPDSSAHSEEDQTDDETRNGQPFALV